MNKKNNKGSITISIIMVIILTLIIIYGILYILPDSIFPKAKLILNSMNYFLILILFGVIQVGLIYGYYKLGRYAVKGFTIVRTKLMNWSINIRNYIVIHS